MGFEVMSRECDQCLVSKNRIVSGARAAQIITGCRLKGVHFVCHKSPAGRSIACRGVHEMQIGQMSRIAERLGAVVSIDPVTLLPTSAEPPSQSGEADAASSAQEDHNPIPPTEGVGQ